MKEKSMSVRAEVFMERMRRKGINFHSVLMQQGNDVVYERYWAPVTADRPHRMYSVTKTFVAIAVGMTAPFLDRMRWKNEKRRGCFLSVFGYSDNYLK